MREASLCHYTPIWVPLHCFLLLPSENSVITLESNRSPKTPSFSTPGCPWGLHNTKMLETKFLTSSTIFYNFILFSLCSLVWLWKLHITWQRCCHFHIFWYGQYEDHKLGLSSAILEWRLYIRLICIFSSSLWENLTCYLLLLFGSPLWEFLGFQHFQIYINKIWGKNKTRDSKHKLGPKIVYLLTFIVLPADAFYVCIINV